MTSPRWDKNTDINPLVTTAAPPAANETCPVCSNDIPEGSPWIINDQDQRMHRSCRVPLGNTLTEAEAWTAQGQHTEPNYAEVASFNLRLIANNVTLLGCYTEAVDYVQSQDGYIDTTMDRVVLMMPTVKV